MKKKITFGLVAFAMVAASAVFMKSIAKDDLSAMIQANVDAFTEFEWDGTLWNEDDTHWFGSAWKPVLADCTLMIGISGFVELTSYGKMVTCNDGDGNCFDGSGCTQL